MNFEHLPVPVICKILGERLQILRLNKNLSQIELAKRSGLSKKQISAAEKGSAKLENIVAIMRVLGKTDSLEALLPEPPLSPIQLFKLSGKQRKRASRNSLPEEARNSLDW